MAKPSLNASPQTHLIIFFLLGNFLLGDVIFS